MAKYEYSNATVPKGAPSNASEHPVGKEAAVRVESHLYNNVRDCAVCGSRTRYTHSDKCARCAREEAIEFRALALGIMTLLEGHSFYPQTYWLGDPQIDTSRELLPEIATMFKKELQIFGESVPPSTKGEATASVLGLYVDQSPCNRSGHIGIKLTNGKCYICERERLAKPLTPRALAIKEGDTWYTPIETCKRCGTLSPRRVNNGECKGCKGQIV